ncbi:MAG: hypothetical protein ACREKE_02820, partial [bacterium]
MAGADSEAPDAVEGPVLDWALTKRLLRRARGQWGDLGLAALLLLLISAAEQLKPTLIGMLLDHWTQGDRSGAVPLFWAVV